MLKSILKRALYFTPYTVVRRASAADDLDVYDAIQHNSLEGINEIFSDPKTLRGYVSAERARQYKHVVDLITEYLSAGERHVFGDFGCGLGDLLALIAQRFPGQDYRGYDFADATLKVARERFPAGQFAKHDLYDDHPGQHSVVTCTQTLEHLLHPDMALGHLIDATAPDGILVLTVPDGRLDQYRGHINFWSPESWAAWLQKNVGGCEVVTRRFAKSKKGHGANLAAVIRKG